MWSRAGREISASFAEEGTPAAALEGLHRCCPTPHVYAQPADDVNRAPTAAPLAPPTQAHVRISG